MNVLTNPLIGYTEVQYLNLLRNIGKGNGNYFNGNIDNKNLGKELLKDGELSNGSQKRFYPFYGACSNNRTTNIYKRGIKMQERNRKKRGREEYERKAFAHSLKLDNIKKKDQKT